MPEYILLNDMILNASFLCSIINPMSCKQLGKYLKNATKPQQVALSPLGIKSKRCAKILTQRSESHWIGLYQ